MAVNKVSLTINSRQYTVVAAENVDYLQSLGNHINEKVELVLKGGQNVMGERPVVLAALNICDEYFKALDAAEVIKDRVRLTNEKNHKLQNTIKSQQAEIDLLKSGQISIDETAVKAEAASAKKELDDANGKIKSLEQHIVTLENRIKSLEKQYDDREKELLDMIDKS